MSSRRNIYQVIKLILTDINKIKDPSPVLKDFKRKILGIQHRAVYYAPEAQMFLWKELSEACYWYFNILYPDKVLLEKEKHSVDYAESWEKIIYEYIVIPEITIP